MVNQVTFRRIGSALVKSQKRITTRHIRLIHLQILTLLLIVGIYTPAFTQPILIGHVIDAKTLEPIAYANVFIMNTTIGTITDEKGNFKLINAPVGQSEIVFSFIGYRSFQSRINLLEDQQMELNPRLIPETKLLESVEVRGDKDKQWEHQFKKFTSSFIGTGNNASLCRIINPWVLEFSEVKGTLKATASADLHIENKSLGYTITYSLKKFELNGSEVLMLGNAFFKEMKTSDEKTRAKWISNRWSAYSGSRQHLIHALLNHTLKGEGFLLYSDISGFENSPRTNVFARELGHSIEKYDTLRIQIIKDIAHQGLTINFKKRIEVHYPNGYPKVTTYEDVLAAVSWIEVKNGVIKINPDGTVLNPESIITSGHMSSLRVADILPNDYHPTLAESKDILSKHNQSTDTTSETFNSHFERVYVQTDKPYYYPGEHIWFSVYMNYPQEHNRHAPSKTLYVELINPAKQILIEKIVRLENGFSSGDFSLADSLLNGQYYLRAYTQFQRNFETKNLFLKTLPVLKMTDKPVAMPEMSSLSDSSLRVTTDHSIYHLRDKITLTLELKDEEDNPIVGNFSVAVTDASQVMRVNEPWTILNEFNIKQEEAIPIVKLNYAIEDGFTIYGQFLSNKKRDVKTQLNVIQLNPYQLSVVDTDEQGYFQCNDLQFYGEASLSIMNANKLKSSDAIRLFKHETPQVILNKSEYKIQFTDVQTVQRIYSEFERPPNSRMLEEVVIKGNRIEDSNAKRAYGPADYVFGEDRIKAQFPNLLYTLQSLNISGLLVNPNTETVYFARSSKPVLISGDNLNLEDVAKSYTPMVTLDGMPLIGSAGEALVAIDPNSVESIEVTKKQSTVRGSLAPYGVIAVYTKKGYLPVRKDPVNTNFIKVQGYDIANKFTAPDYQIPVTEKTADYRSTLYWNPRVITNDVNGKAQVSFYSSDLQGPYRVVVEGIGANNQPMRSVSFIEVKEE